MAFKYPLVPAPINLMPDAASVTFPTFQTVKNPDGSTSLQVVANVKINTMQATQELDGPVYTGYYTHTPTQYAIMKGAQVRFWDAKLYIVTSDGQLILSSWMTNIGDAYIVPGTFSLTDSDYTAEVDAQGNQTKYDNRWGGGYTGQNGVYAFVVIYAVMRSTEIQGTQAPATGFTGARILIAGQGTPPPGTT